MTPAIALTFSAQFAQLSSAVIGQQMRLTQAILDQGLATQKAFLKPFWQIEAPIV